MIVRLEWWLAIGSLALVSYLVRSALFRDTPVPIGRVALTPGQQAWGGALIVIPTCNRHRDRRISNSADRLRL